MNTKKYCLVIKRRFQGFGLMFSFDNAITTNEYFLIEFRFLWLKFWYIYYL